MRLTGFLQTSALDTYTEADVARNINNVLLDKQRTSVFVAHRLKTIADSGKPGLFTVHPAEAHPVYRSHHCTQRR